MNWVDRKDEIVDNHLVDFENIVGILLAKLPLTKSNKK